MGCCLRQQHIQESLTQLHVLLQTLFLPGLTAMLGVGPSWAVGCDDGEWPEQISKSSRLLEMVHKLVKVRCGEVLQVCFFPQPCDCAKLLTSGNTLRRVWFLGSLQGGVHCLRQAHP